MVSIIGCFECALFFTKIDQLLFAMPEVLKLVHDDLAVLSHATSPSVSKFADVCLEDRLPPLSGCSAM
jgi:hypothetical protein